ncbi:uncharacterized protein LOC112158152 isoform X2 [Oryzias melastigma]|uniref:uncharacterized protein LOC112158152 isoform X2 n=1 Tax=Oryzias melastigma TaxID=30732 RepID=UPI00168D4097|nr:uncharacterized protein LOC112158152 isoform X2 [Oryzias melastigma]
MNIYLQKEISKDRMTLCLELFIIFMLQSGGISGREEYLYKRVGEDVLLDCGAGRSSNQCSDVQWLHNRPKSSETKTLINGKDVEKSLIRPSSLSLGSNCSLIIGNIANKDAGRYTCRILDWDNNVYLNILSISSSLSDVKARVDLTCSMKSFNDDFCEQNSFIWMDETRTELSGKNSEFEVKKQTNCDSVLTVKHQSGNKRFTCQFVKDNKVKIEAVTGISGQTERLYHRVGDDVILSCRDESSSSSCSDVNWLYTKDPSSELRTEVQNGKVVQSSVGASRLSVSSNCSLFIRNITDEDVGGYICQLKNKNDAHLVLNTLSISSDLPEVHPRENGSVTLLCSLNRYDKRIPCKENSIIWRDERGSHLIGEGVWFEFRGQTNCVSVLVEKHQSGNNKRLTCQFVEDNTVKIDAVYTYLPDRSDPTQSNPVINPVINPVVIIGAVVGVVLVLLVIFAVLLFRTKRAKTTKDHNGGKDFQMPAYQNNEPDSGPESELTYAAVNHSRSKATSKITIKEEEGEVTYSTVKRN